MTDNKTNLLNTSSFMYGASALASIVGAGINYNLMKIQNNNLAIQANQIELQAQQELNQYREQFNSNLAQIQYNSTLRGIKQSSGVIQNSIMKLSEDVGDDFNIIRNNATLQANALRSQQSINKRTNRANLYGSIAGTLIGTGAKLYDNSLLNDKINSLNNSII